MPEKVYVGIGSNIGDKKGSIIKALELLKADGRFSGVKTAPFYKTDPVGYTDQDWFLNTVAAFETDLSPHELLRVLMSIEEEMGRVRTIRWGPRVIDLDIILYGDLKIDFPNLQVPHPRLEERAFVVAPLADLSPDLVMPCGKTSFLLAEELIKTQSIERYFK
ncbi:MAG: 2-amino-4-hydroxy-6-hydroxymethyldihydropteridine diphosphokinase [Bacillota bacterium]